MSGETVNFTPYITGSVAAAKPFEGYYDAPVYDMTDNVGAFDDDGNPIGMEFWIILATFFIKTLELDKKR